MLQTALGYWTKLDSENRDRFRFIQVSTDEVYGSLGAEGLFTEATAYRPNSPYIQRARQGLVTWRGRGTRRLAYQPLSRIVRTIMALFRTAKN